MITQRFLWSKKRDIGEALSRAQGHGMDSFVASLACLKEKMCCGLWGWYITCDRTNLTGFIFQERQTFHWDATLSVEKNMSFPGVTHLKKHNPRLTLPKTLCPLHFPVCAKYHIFTFAELLQNICRHQGFCQDGAFEIFCLENGAREVSTFQIRLNSWKLWTGNALRCW